MDSKTITTHGLGSPELRLEESQSYSDGFPLVMLAATTSGSLNARSTSWVALSSGDARVLCDWLIGWLAEHE